MTLWISIFQVISLVSCHQLKSHTRVLNFNLALNHYLTWVSNFRVTHCAKRSCLMYVLLFQDHIVLGPFSAIVEHYGSETEYVADLSDDSSGGDSIDRSASIRKMRRGCEKCKGLCEDPFTLCLKCFRVSNQPTAMKLPSTSQFVDRLSFVFAAEADVRPYKTERKAEKMRKTHTRRR